MNALKVFCSYSHHDKRFRDKFVDEHLAALRHAKLIDTWTDRDIPPGRTGAQRLIMRWSPPILSFF
jgi:hypothetical protein